MRCIEQDSLERRRSIYHLGNTAVISDNCLINTISSCLKHCPTPFNVQSARLVILLQAQHKKLWDLVWQNMRKILSDKEQKQAKNRIETFRQAYGTILFFEDTSAIKKLKKQYPLYKKNMSVWAQQANGMLQYMIWQALAENDVGASLQHYNELIEADVNQVFSIPKN